MYAPQALSVSQSRLTKRWVADFIMALVWGHPNIAKRVVDESGVFAAAVRLYRRVVPDGLTAEWWVQTHNKMDITSFRLNTLFGCMASTSMGATSGVSMPGKELPPVEIQRLAHAMVLMNSEACLLYTSPSPRDRG